MRLRVTAAFLASSFVFSGAALAAAPMSFRAAALDTGSCGAHCPAVVIADGEITEQTPQAFIDFLRANLRKRELRAVVVVNSPGGKVVSSMVLGKIFRKLGVATIVARADVAGGRAALAPGRCYSACVYAMMGGRTRIVPPPSKVGVHRMFTYEPGVDPAGGGGRLMRFDDGKMSGVLSRYSRSMGVSGDIVVSAERTPSDGIHVLTPGEIARWRLGDKRL
ncbi:MAG: hypothetical protein KGL46_13475 [Hyphomicrobiales bacterium]|nr:hypothetical protein [Hyphomicrobiales bacterium]